jgi:hypothetical protein
LKARKLPIAVIALAICGALAMTGIALGATKTKVTIEAQAGGFFGYVHSPKQKCELNRKVKLYKQRGHHHNRRVDKLIGSDIAQPNGPDSMWSVNTNRSGRFYAFTKKAHGCTKDYSKTVHSER